MEIKLRKYKDIFIMDLSGEMDLYNSPKVKDVFNKLRDKKVDKYVINLESVEYIDSSGIGALLQIHSMTQGKGEKLLLTNIHGTVKKVLTLTRLDGFLPVCETVEQALHDLS